MCETNIDDLPIDFSLRLQIGGGGTAFRIDGQTNIQLSYVHLHAQCRETRDIGGDRFIIWMQRTQVHFESDAMDRNATPPEIAHH